jgi:hypothetical protein
VEGIRKKNWHSEENLISKKENKKKGETEVTRVSLGLIRERSYKENKKTDKTYERSLESNRISETSASWRKDVEERWNSPVEMSVQAKESEEEGGSVDGDEEREEEGGET